MGETTEHLTEHKVAVEQSWAAPERELTQDSGVAGSEAEHEGEAFSGGTYWVTGVGLTYLGKTSWGGSY